MQKKRAALTTELLREAAENCLCFKARKAARAVTRFYDQHFAGAEIEPAQFNLLVALHLTQPVPLQHLAGHLGLERTTFTRNLRLLQRNGLVEIQRGEDARERLLSLSPSGERTLQNAIPYWQRAQQAAMSLMGHDNFSHLSEALPLSDKFISNKTVKNKTHEK